MFGIKRSTSQPEIEKGAALTTIIKVREAVKDIKEAMEAKATTVAAAEAEEIKEAKATAVVKATTNKRIEVEMGATITTGKIKGGITTTGPMTNE